MRIKNILCASLLIMTSAPLLHAQKMMYINMKDGSSATEISYSLVRKMTFGDDGVMTLLRKDDFTKAFTWKNIRSIKFSKATPTAINNVLCTEGKASKAGADADTSTSSAQAQGKYFKDGKLVIIKNGAMYNAAGQLMETGN